MRDYWGGEPLDRPTLPRFVTCEHCSEEIDVFESWERHYGDTGTVICEHCGESQTVAAEY